ncbi:MAG: hypothetical protein WC943_01690 [Elusimicrobiota bacterium]
MRRTILACSLVLAFMPAPLLGADGEEAPTDQSEHDQEVLAIREAFNNISDPAQKQRISDKIKGLAGVVGTEVGGELDALFNLDPAKDPDDIRLWKSVLNGLNTEDISWFQKNYTKVDPMIFTEALKNAPDKPGQSPQAPKPPTPGTKPPQTASGTSDPGSAAGTDPNQAAANDAWNYVPGQNAPSESKTPAAAGSAAGAGGAAGGLDKETAALLKKRSLTGKEADGVKKAAGGISKAAGSGFGPDKRPEDIGGGEGGGQPGERPSSEPRPGSSSASAPPAPWTPPRPTKDASPAQSSAPGWASPTASARPLPAKQPSGVMPDIPSKYSRVRGDVPAPAQDFGGAGQAGSGSQPGAGASGGSFGSGYGSQGGGLSASPARPRAGGPGGRGAADDDALTDEERRELDEFIGMLTNASKTGRLSPKANEALVAAESRGNRSSAMSRALDSVRDIFQKSGKDWSGQDRIAVEGALRQLGIRLSPSQVDVLYRSLRLAYPPPPKVVRQASLWERILKWLRSQLQKP